MSFFFKGKEVEAVLFSPLLGKPQASTMIR